jgi:DNA polymerase elongation subunit (family B)
LEAKRLIIERGRNNGIVVRYRNEKGERCIDNVSGQQPYCYVQDVRGDDVGLYGEPLAKRQFTTTQDMSEFAKNNETWESNIAWENRVLADSGRFYENYEHRVWYLDMEWKIVSGEITIIVVRDSQVGEMVWFHHEDYEEGYYDSIPAKNHPYGKDACESGDRKFKCFANEREMLLDFVRMLVKQDPDIITGWNVINADIQQLLKRFQANNLDARLLSPMKRLRYDFGDWGQPLVGINCIDLMVGFKKLWTLKNGQLPAMSLDAVSEFCLGDKKVPLEDGHDTYYTDFGTYLDYARQDVDLLPRLNDLVDVLGYFTALQHIVQCDIRSTPFVTKMFSVLALRDPQFVRKIPSSPRFAKVEYEGADIMQPIAGLYRNIGIFDVKAMYHSNISKFGIYWTTLSEDGEDCGNGIKFDRSKKGLLCRQMDNMTVLRNEYKRKMKKAETDSERKRYDALQYATKSLVASMYGVAGDAKYGMYHPDIAAAITYTSRNTLGELRDIAEEMGYPVIYGHTDSIMCEIPTPEEGVEALKIINERMHPIETEFEKWSSTFLVVAKNRYTGLVSWTEGEHHEPERYVKGIEMKQSRLPKAMKNAMGMVIDGILNDHNPCDITSNLTSLVSDVVNRNIPAEELAIKAKLKNDLHKYRVLSEARAGAAWANEHLGKGYRKDSYFYCLLNDRGEYIGFDEPSEIEGIAEIGYQHMAQKFIIDKVKPYYEVMGWDYIPLENALRGLDKTAWI